MSVVLSHDFMSPKPFDVESCHSTLVSACEAVGLRHTDARLIRLGENAIFHLQEARLVARIGRGIDVLDDARKELRVAQWLIDSGFDTASPEICTEPLVIDQRPVTFWRYIEHEDVKSTAGELGHTLRALHSLTPPDSLELPAHDMFGRVDTRIENAHKIPQSDLAFLRRRAVELREQYARLEFPLGRSIIHGDAHVGNLLRRVGGGTALIDLERSAFGQPETDIAGTASEYEIGWHSDSEYADFVDGYGFDIRSWEGFPVMRAVGELKMVTWLMQNIGHGPAVDAEIRRRLDDLRYPERPRQWNPM